MEEPSRTWCSRDGIRRHWDSITANLAPGLYVTDAPEFERWLEGERHRLRDLAFQAASAVATGAESAGNGAGAIEALRRAAELRPEDEGILRRLIQQLERMGDRASALRTYEQFAGRLRSELEIEPSPETQALAGDLRRPSPPPLFARASVAEGVTPTPAASPAVALPATPPAPPARWWQRSGAPPPPSAPRRRTRSGRCCGR